MIFIFSLFMIFYFFILFKVGLDLLLFGLEVLNGLFKLVIFSGRVCTTKRDSSVSDNDSNC